MRLNPYESVQQDYGTRNFDDFYVNDGARLTPMQVTTRFPTAVVDDDWMLAGASSAVAAVTPPVDMLNKFIYASTDGAQETFTSATVLPDNNPIKYLQLITLFRKATSDPMSLVLNIDDREATVANISRDWTYRYTPISATGYDAGNIVTAEFGVRLKL